METTQMSLLYKLHFFSVYTETIMLYVCYLLYHMQQSCTCIYDKLALNEKKAIFFQVSLYQNADFLNFYLNKIKDAK